MNNLGKYNHPGESIPLVNIPEESKTTTPTNELIKLITVSELSCVFSLSPSMIYKLVGEDRIPCYRFGRAVRFNPREIERWLKSQRVESKFQASTNAQLERDVDKILNSTRIGTKI